MLYITTRNDTDAFTHPRTLTDDRASDGGFYVPFRMPEFSSEDLIAFKEYSFSETVAKLMNLFFNAGLEAGDVDFSIGRVPIKLQSIKYRTVVNETWHNPDSDYGFLVRQLCIRLCPGVKRPSAWFELAVRISVYFGTYAQMLANGHIQPEEIFDVAVSAGNYVDMFAAHYAKKMGLPIGKIVCGCEDDILWNLLHRGEVSTKNLSDEMKACLELFLYCKLGCSAVREFVECCEKSQVYSVCEAKRDLLADSIFAAVVTDNRVDAVINSVYKTNSYLIDTKHVTPYAALQDHRTKAGESRVTLFCADVTPAKDAARICKAAGITEEQLSLVMN